MTTRRLAAILAADVAGFSALMERDEEGTFARIGNLRRDVIEPHLSEHQGRLIKTTGDGFLIEFASPIAALRCALAIQANLTNDPDALRLRIGINLGDVIIEEGGDIYGEGVNVAARLEALAEPGGILISDKIHREVEGKVEAAFENRGEQQVKNISRPVHVYAVHGAASASQRTNTASPLKSPALSLPDKPSIAVLPFQNMSGDPEQDYFADGIVEEIITALSRFKWLFVMARNSSFTFKGRAVDIKEVGRSLGVRYVLEGSVRKTSGKVRITGQLIDAVTGAHLWADRFERDLTDIFALQDEVTVAVVSAIQPKLLQTEIEMATRRRPENLTAYDLYLRARQKSYTRNRESIAETLQLAHRALDLDPRFVLAAALAALMHRENIAQGFAVDPQFDRNEATRLVRLALSLDENDDAVLTAAGLHAIFFAGDNETAIDFADRAVASNPNDPRAWLNRGWIYKFAGQHEEAIRSFERSIPLSPLDPLLHIGLAGIGFALIELRRFDEAVAVSKKALRRSSTYPPTYRGLASAFAHLGRDAEAREAAARLLEVDRAFTISAWIARGGQTNSKLLIEGLRKAGLPE